jgi:1,4-dihydroxy-2-naphthoate octaprenyltransferase
MTTEALIPSRQKLWMAAIKPPMYSVAVIPLWVGTAIAFFEHHSIHWDTFGLFLLSALCIVAWSNISNDVYDSETGIDVHKFHSLVNLTGNKTLVFWIGNGLLTCGILGIVAIALQQQDVTVLGLVLACCALGYLYQGPPFRLGYQGWGEVLCFMAYGPLALTAVYYSQTGEWSAINLAASVIIGLTTSLILFCSHFHQVEDDIAAGKRSPIVRLGTSQGAQLLPWWCLCTFGAILGAIGFHLFPVQTGFAFGSIPCAIHLCRFIGKCHDQPSAVNDSKFIAVALHFWSGLLLGIGFWVA